MKSYSFLQTKYVVNTYAHRGVVFVEGQNVYLVDINGEKYLDLMTNYGVNILGYKHPEVTQSLSRQLERLTTLHGSFTNDMRAEAASALTRRCGGGLAQAYFSNSGAEANEAALKFAVLATEKKKFISCKGGYHGKTLGALSATDSAKYRSPFEPLLWEFDRVEYNNLAALAEAIDEQTAGFIVEPIQGEGGVDVPDVGYLKKAREICEEKGVLFILDEIQTGGGRTGHFLASHPEEISYDIVSLGKGLAGGLPVGVTLISQKIAESVPKSSHTSTFGGNPLVCAGVLVTLKLLDDERLSHVEQIGDYFLSGLRRIQSGQIMKIKGKGLMLGIQVADRRNEILKKLQENKILAIPAAEDVVRFLPPFILENHHVDHTIEIIDQIFQDL